MKEASAVTPSTQFFPLVTSASCIISLRSPQSRLTRRLLQDERKSLKRRGQKYFLPPNPFGGAKRLGGDT
jgi:hypothetical protein